VDRARATAPPEPRFDARVRLALIEARVDAADKRGEGARRGLSAALAEARRARHVVLDLEAQLASLSVGGKSARLAARALQADAARRGFRRIAREAGALAD
jgi:hypothetical protein